MHQDGLILRTFWWCPAALGRSRSGRDSREEGYKGGGEGRMKGRGMLGC